MCRKTCIFFFFPIINKCLCMAKRSLLSRCPSYVGRNVKHPLLLSDFNKTLISSTFSKNTQISTRVKIRPVGAELFHADRLTGMTKLIVAFRGFANSSKNGRNLETFQKKNASSEIGAHWIGKYFHLN